MGLCFTVQKKQVNKSPVSSYLYIIYNTFLISSAILLITGTTTLLPACLYNRLKQKAGIYASFSV
nr:MAG TPA: hypothetical protein [Caudoviricetes sp.]